MNKHPSSVKYDSAKPVKPLVKKLPRLLLYIGLGLSASIFGFTTYKTAYGTAVDAEEFTRVVRDDIAKVFTTQMPALNGTSFSVDIFSGAKMTPCGSADNQTGAFYCSSDKHISLPLEFMNRLCRDFKACDLKTSREYVYAYVLAHEAAHFIQDKIGAMNARNAAWTGVATLKFNLESIKIELQADCLAGVYLGVRFAKSPRAKSDGIEAANALGDDILQPNLSPEQYGHGRGKDRAAAFERGYTAASVKACIVE